ncbi:MAG: SH3 domain-containing C40 family peptidase [Gemmatimonadaceae bacterium]
MTEESHRVTVRTPVAQLFAEPRVASAQISQLVAGRTADVLERRDDWLRVRGPDQYEGWVHRGYVIQVPPAAARSDAHDARISLGCMTSTASGMQRSMPLGAQLSDDERVISGDVVATSRQAALFPAEAGAITESALKFFEGTSYLWGGVTPWGADCSGLAQTSFWLHGIPLRRDAWQQALQGNPGESDLMRAQAADLLFFSDRVDRHITHVAISLGEGSLVHLALGRGGYAVERLGDVHDPYVRKLRERFVTARRVLG